MSALQPKVWRSQGALRVLAMGRALPPQWEATTLFEHVDATFGTSIASKATRIASRLNIRRKHLARPLLARREKPLSGCSNAELAASAVRASLAEAELDIDDLGYLIGHTASPDTLLPPNVGVVAELLNYRGPIAEFRQACVGFGNALAFAFGLLRDADSAPVAVVGSECGSLAFDPLRAVEDDGQLINLVQMGDGAAAIILAPDGRNKGCGRIESLFTGQIGWKRPSSFSLGVGPDGALEFAHAFERVREFGLDLFDQGVMAHAAAGLAIAEADLIIPHQANGRMNDVLASRYDVARERVFVHADRFGNTGSAAIWLALEEARGLLPAGATAAILGAEATKSMFAGFLYHAR